MDPMWESCFSLNVNETQKAIQEEKERDEKFLDIIVSCKSLSYYEVKKAKTLLPQIIAASLVASFHIVAGIGLAVSAIILPQLTYTNGTNSTIDDTRFYITKSEGAWVASIIVLAIPVGAPFSGIVMDTVGRLTTVKMAAIPGVIGWILIATSYNLPMLLIGRLFTGFSSALGTGPAIVYLTEIARADMRGCLISLAPAYASLGMVLTYVKGWFLGWQLLAWLCLIYTILPCLLLFLIPESPPWLVSRGRNEEALKSLNWINKYQPQPENRLQSLSEMQLDRLQTAHIKKVEQEAKSGTGLMAKVKCFLKPTGYKPLIILFGIFFFQQFSGIYITLFYSVTFFSDVGSNVDPYLCSIMLGVLRCIMSVANTYMLGKFRRRPLILTSCLGMAICMTVSGLFTKWIKEGTTELTWIPVAALGMYIVMSMVGLLTIPWTMTAELFPLEIRGVAHSLIYGIGYLLMFFSIQSYYTLDALFGGSAGIQFFFAVVSVLGLVYAFIFLPETHGWKLTDIEEYFVHNWIYLGQKKKDDKKQKKEKIPLQSKDIVKPTNGDVHEKLLKV